MLRPEGHLREAWRAVRFLLALLLTFDLVSAPFHAHVHDGFGELHGHAIAHAQVVDDGGSDSGLHAEADDQLLPSHGVLGIRVEQSQRMRLPVTANLQAAFLPVRSEFDVAAIVEPSAPTWRPGLAQPPVRSHRSLPPAGRAPPLHA